MKELSKLYNEAGQEFIDDLFKDYLVVTEKLSGSSLSFEKSGDNILFYKGSAERPINLIDRTIMVYYEKAIEYIKSTTAGIMLDIPDNWRFCFQYFAHNEPGVIGYTNLPKNHLVLTHIQVKNESGKVAKIIEDPRVINDWAYLLDVTPLIPFFKGYLTEKQKEKIRSFLSTPKEDHLEVFKTSSFAEYILKILNPSVSSTILHDDLSQPIDSIIFKFYKPGSTQAISAKMIDPYTMNIMKEKQPVDLRRVPADINEIVLLDLLAFIEERGLKAHDVLSASPEERYVELISNIFNDYVRKRGGDLKNIDIEKAKFAKGDEFNLNIDIIPNQTTKDILGKNESLQDLFKIMLGSFRKKRNPNNTGNIMTPSVIEDFNKMVDKIEKVTEKEDDGMFKTFGDYLKLKATNESLFEDGDYIYFEKDKIIDNFLKESKIVITNNNMKNLKYYNEFVNERSLPVNINKEVVGAVNADDTESIDAIKRIAGSSQGKAEMKSFLTTIGIPEERQSELINLISGGDWPKATAYLLDRTLDVSSILGKPLFAFDVNKKFLGVTDKKLSRQLFLFQWPSQPPMGKGEAWLGLMLKGGSKAGVGDVEINGMETEVKGDGARLIGQKGFGDAKKMPEHLIKAISNIAAQLSITYTPKNGTGLEWNIGKSSARLLEENLVELAKLNGGFSSKDISFISNEIISAYKNIYTGLQITKYRNSLDKAISKDGTINVNIYNTALLKIAFEYYHQVEQFTYFALTNKNTGKFLIIEPKDFGKLVDSNVIGFTPPSFGQKAGTQGAGFSITLK